MNFPYNLNEILPLGQRDVVKIGHDLLPVGSSSSGSVGGKTFFVLQVTSWQVKLHENGIVLFVLKCINYYSNTEPNLFG